MKKLLFFGLIACFTLSSASPAVGQWERQTGKLLIADAMLPMPAGPGKVAFFRSDPKIPGTPIELFVADMENGKERRALPGHDFRKDPGLAAAFSPDGSKLVVQDKYKGGWELFLYEDGQRVDEPITNLAQYRPEMTREQQDALGIDPDMLVTVAELAFSPSGKRVILTLSRPGNTSVWWHDLETGETRQATEDRVGYSAYFFPDDEHICYTEMVKKSGLLSDEDIIKRSIITGETDTLCHSENHEYRPVVSPDGKYLLYTMRTDNLNNIYVMNLESRESRQVTNVEPGQNCAVSAWSSDGKHILIQGAGFRALPALFIKEFEPF
jgi:WD40 repeat protein